MSGLAHRFQSAIADGADPNKVRPSNWNDDHDVPGFAFVTEKQFGAKADGATNDTVAIHLARDSGKKTVYFPDGTYLVSGLTMSVAGQRWLLAPGATIKLADGSDTTVVTITGEGCTIEGGTVDGNKANQAAGGIGVRIGGDSCRVVNVEVRNTLWAGIYAPDHDGPHIEGCRVYDSDYTGIFVNITAGVSRSGAVVMGNLVDRVSAGAGVVQGGIKILGDNAGNEHRRPRVHGNHVRMPTSPSSAEAICIEVWGGCPYATVTGNVTEGGSMGISVNDSDYTAVSGNTVFGPSSYGLEIAASRGVSMVGNTIDGNALTVRGVSASGAGLGHCVISANTIRNLAAAGLVAGIRVSDSGAYLVISGNLVEVAARYGIEVSACQYFSIAGNVLLGGGTATKAIMLDHSDRCAVSGNTLHSFTQNGVLIFASSAVTLNNISVSGNMMEAVNQPVRSLLSGGAALGRDVRWGDNASDIGSGSARVDMIDALANLQVITRAGSPEGVNTAGIGSVCHVRDGGAGTCLYVKESGSGNTGWVAK